MAVYLDDIKPLRLTKTEFFLPINEEDKRKNSAIFLLTPNLESSVNMMKHPLALNRKLFESYYIEKDIAFVLNESRQLVRNDISPIYEYVDCISESLMYAQRQKLPNSAFGLPTERKYPMVNAHSVKSAIKLFWHCPKEKRGQLAENISKMARKYKVKVDPHWKGWIYVDESVRLEGSVPIESIPMDSTRMHHKKRNKKLSKSIDAANHDIQKRILEEEVEDIIVEDYNRPYEEYAINEDFVHTNYNHEEFKIFFGDSVQSILEEENPKSKLYSAAMRKLLYSERIRNQKDCVLIHDKVKAELQFIRYTYINYALYKQKNLFIDWSYYTQTFFKNNIYKMDKAVDLYFEFMTRFLTDTRLDEHGYKIKTVFIPVQDWIKEDIVAWDYTKDINPISVIYRLLKRKSTELRDKWGGYTFVFFSDKAYFKLDFKDFDDKGLPIFTTLISKLKTDQIQDADFEKNDSPKAIVHKIVDNIEDGGIEISNLTGGTSKLSPEEIKNKLDIAIPDKTIDDKRSKEDIEEERKAKLVAHIKGTAEKSTDEKNAMENLNTDVDSDWVKQLIIDLQSEDGPNAFDLAE